VRKMVAGILTADGYRVTALKAFPDVEGEPPPLRPVQLLIASLAGDGERSARAMHAMYPNLRVLCTSNFDFKLPIGWLAANRQAGLNKPYALSELIRAARKLLDA
jgi:two-component system, cell cycle sensor histidine kinase and response regulator CckA